MPNIFEQRKLLRSLAVGTALVGSLAMASAASAAVGGGPSAKFTNRPNLQSVTYNGLVASFTFDHSLQPGPNFGDNRFKIGSYGNIVNRVNSNAASSIANISVTNPETVLVTYPGTATDDVDFNVNTFGAVGPGVVRGLGSFGNGNFPDATSITGAEGESGTGGHTSGPDLESVAIDSSNNRITYTFDQNVSEDETPPGPGAFAFLDVNGNPRGAASIVSVSGPDVVAQFGGSPLNDVDRARQGVTAGVLGAETNSLGAVFANTGVPGKDPLTLAPSLVSTTLEPNTNTLVFNFDQPVSTPAAGGFFVQTSDGLPHGATNAVVEGGTHVRATFSSSAFVEHIVRGAVAPGAIVGTNSGVPNAFTGKPAGGNIGAKATGYTTAPDPIQATVNPNGQVSILLDSRVDSTGPGFNVNAANFRLLDDDGTVIATATPGTASVIQSAGGPSQARVVLQFTPQEVAVGDYIAMNGNSVPAGGGWNEAAGNAAVVGTIATGAALPEAYNVLSILDPTATTTNFSK